MDEIIVPKKIYTQPISWFSDESLVAYFEKRGMKTVEDAIDNQGKLPKKIREKMMLKLGYAVFNVRPAKTEP